MPPFVQLTLALNFVQSTAPSFPSSEGPGSTPNQGYLENVVAMGGQYRWLAVQSADSSLQMDPGPKDPQTGYAVAPFTNFLDDLLAGLVDPGVSYTSELFLANHILNDGQWIRGSGHILKLLANGDPLIQEARIVGLEFEVEILICVQVVG